VIPEFIQERLEDHRKQRLDEFGRITGTDLLKHKLKANVGRRARERRAAIIPRASGQLYE
jgi:hypothetical protein